MTDEMLQTELLENRERRSLFLRVPFESPHLHHDGSGFATRTPVADSTFGKSCEIRAFPLFAFRTHFRKPFILSVGFALDVGRSEPLLSESPHLELQMQSLARGVRLLLVRWGRFSL